MRKVATIKRTTKTTIMGRGQLPGVTTWLLISCMALGLLIGCAASDGSSGEGEAGANLSESGSSTPETGTELIERSIRFHDPDGVWGSAKIEIDQESSRPDGSSRVDSVTVQQGGDLFRLVSMRDGKKVELEVGPDNVVHAMVDGHQPTEEIAKTLRLAGDAARRTRNYYVYLFGLPMKLQDPGTVVASEVREMEHLGRQAYEVKVSYDPEVGSDVWYFQFDRETAEMIGYKFYHDEAANNGEYIRLEGLEQVNGLRLPKERAWYRFEGDEYLGTDILHARALEAGTE